MKYKWVMFDADGTLFDYDKVEVEALESTYEELGLAYDEAHARAYRQINGDMWLDFEKGQISQRRLRTKRFELLFEAVQIECDIERFSRRYLAHLAQGTDLIDGAESVVSRLYGRLGLLLITNGLSEVQRPRFARSAVGQYFSNVVISEEVGVAKPDPRIFDVAFQEMGHPNKADVLIVGDSLTSDIKGGNLYGIDTCWFNPGRKLLDPGLEVRYEIGELAELLEFLDHD
jgi:putative hydrolase of the HAD superfamily